MRFLCFVANLIENSAPTYLEEVPGPAPGRRRSCPGRQPPPPVRRGGEQEVQSLFIACVTNREVEYYTQGHLEKALKKLYQGSLENNLQNTQQMSNT